MAAVHLSNPPDHGADHTLRVRISYRGDAFEITRVDRVRMIAPMSATADPPSQDQPGFWFELRGPKGEALFHKVLSQPNKADHEVFSPDAERSIHREPRPADPEGEVTLLVPDIPNAAQFLLHASPMKEPQAPATPRLQHKFTLLRRAAADPRTLQEGKREE
jgi:hypothetical protein